MVTPILEYVAETWTITKGKVGKLTAIEIRFLRKFKNKTRQNRIRKKPSGVI